MPNISKIKLPSGNTYDIVDAGARDLIAALEGSTAYIGVTTTALVDNSTTNPIIIDGSSVTATSGNIAVYGNKEFIFDGTKWREFGDLSSLGTLATKNTVTLNKGTGDNVLGVDTTFGVSLGTPTKDTFVKSVSAETNKKLVTTTVPNVTNVGAASTWNFSIGTGTDTETLIISGGNGSAPTLGAEKTVATGATAANGGGDAIVTGITVGQSADAVTALGTATVTVGTNDQVNVAKYGDLSVTVS